MELCDLGLNLCLHPDECCEYSSVRYITVKDKKLVTIYWLLMLLVLCYVVGYTLIAEKGYQEQSAAIGTSSVKIKGSASIGNMSDYKNVTELLPLDSMDGILFIESCNPKYSIFYTVVVPVNEKGAFFITTARVITKNQTRGFCDGIETEKCTKDDASECQKKLFNEDSQGIYTGECGDDNHCQMYTWCPMEDERNLEIINNIGAMTVFVKIDIDFEKFGVHRVNQYDINNDMKPVFGYNLWTIDQILGNATDGKIQSYKEVAEHGAVILFSSIWNCNLDRGGEKNCHPKYEMQRIDNTPDTISSGFNFRNVLYDPTESARVLKKLYGIRVIFIVEGSAGKFSWAQFTETLGSGIAYMGMAAILTDIILENFLPESSLYLEHKEKEIKQHIDKKQSGSQSAKTAGSSRKSDRQSNTLKTC